MDRDIRPKYDVVAEATQVVLDKWDAYKMSPTERLAAKWRGLIHGPKPPRWMFVAPVLVAATLFLNYKFSDHSDKNFLQDASHPAVSGPVTPQNSYESAIYPSFSATKIR